MEPEEWGAVAVAHSPQGLAVVDGAGRFVAANAAASRLCGAPAADLVGRPAPFAADGAAEAGEVVVEWTRPDGEQRAFACTTAPVPGTDQRVVAFRDVSEARRQERRLAAMARAAFSVTAERSLASTLEALAEEAQQAAALAGVQVLLATPAGARLHVLGTAGFSRIPDFFDRLLECQARGARLEMVESLRSGVPRVLQHRFDAIMGDPAWEPLHDYMSATPWDAFASVPLRIRGGAVGVLNAFFAPGQEVGEAELGFLLAMADQAAVAVDHAELFQRRMDEARREERQKLARDLHDSVVQQVFSIMMQAGSLGVLARRGLPPSAERLATIAGELSGAAEDALADLRGMVVELRPAVPSGTSLGTALRSLLEATAARSALACDLTIDDAGGDLPALDVELAEDVYRVASEAVHNTVKHAGASRLDVAVVVGATATGPRVVVDVVDDGRGARHDAAAGPGAAAAGGQPGSRASSGGYGMTAMRERAHRWGGEVDVVAEDGGGTRVRLVVPVVRGEDRR
ncbi:PAS fold-containing protein [Quadrisphaera granulorum]|uniref:PAS domain-containing protein n=1 Tax=Quadrisphaera granulorum TaxID=317664 RepID=A0A316AA20_9ACTN|nr:histidine kinase [Quadrisphaera granulorum]PWJ54372.1 PAS domain-containing protein [Quadrisphaera granulorum]SZE96144.1 PAS fold-containing protein [Quadrisphaera granulorum]